MTTQPRSTSPSIRSLWLWVVVVILFATALTYYGYRVTKHTDQPAVEHGIQP